MICFPLDNTEYEAKDMGGIPWYAHARRVFCGRELCRYTGRKWTCREGVPGACVA